MLQVKRRVQKVPVCFAGICKFQHEFAAVTRAFRCPPESRRDRRLAPRAAAELAAPMDALLLWRVRMGPPCRVYCGCRIAETRFPLPGVSCNPATGDFNTYGGVSHDAQRGG